MRFSLSAVHTHLHGQTDLRLRFITHQRQHNERLWSFFFPGKNRSGSIPLHPPRPIPPTALKPSWRVRGRRRRLNVMTYLFEFLLVAAFFSVRRSCNVVWFLIMWRKRILKSDAHRHYQFCFPFVICCVHVLCLPWLLIIPVWHHGSMWLLSIPKKQVLVEGWQQQSDVELKSKWTQPCTHNGSTLCIVQNPVCSVIG